MGTTQILIAYTAVVSTIVGGVIMFLLKEFFPLKSLVNRIKIDLYGNGSRDGLLTDVSEQHESLNDRLNRIDQHQQDLSDDMEDLQHDFRRLVITLEEQTEVEDLPETGARNRDRWQGGDTD